MILVICGAGASYDSLDSRPPETFGRSLLYQRPPLANELFLPDNAIVAEGLKTFHQCHPVVPYLRRATEGFSVENELEKLQLEADRDGVRKQQLAAVMFYLRFLIERFEREWKSVHNGTTNYVTMVDQLRRSHGKEPVCIVTFNYDRMIENALRKVGIQFGSLDDYINNPEFKLFKLHGSIDWVNDVKAPFDQVNAGRNEKEVIEELIESAEKIEVSSNFHLCRAYSAGKIGAMPIWPAIAIPVTTKNKFVCPEDHLKCLRELLPNTSKVVIIGWRGMETHFLTMLSESLAGKQIGIFAANGKEAESESTLANLTQAGISTGAAIPYKAGFTQLIISRGVEKFCA